MKKLLLTSFAAAAILQANAQTYSHVPVPVTGFTADVIADGSGSASASTTADVDGGNYNFVAQNFVNPSNVSPTSYLPGSGLINSIATPGLPFQLAPYTGNNSLRLTYTVPTGTLTFATPRSADKLNILVTTAYPSTFTATVNFTDATSQAFTGNSVPNWFDGASPAIQGISRVLRTTNAIENSTTNPRMYQYSLLLTGGNNAKTIQSITFTKTSLTPDEILHIFAVTASMALPNDIGISAITAPTTPVAPGISQPVAVTVKNYGTNSLTSATLGFSVDGTTVVNNFPFTASPALTTNGVSAPVTIGNFTFPNGSHKIKAWTKLPNGIADGSAFNDTVEVNLNACNALTGNYTIDKTSSASATNFTSFASAIQALSNCGINGAVTIAVAPNSGPYTEQVTLPVIAGTSAANTVTFEGNGNTLTAVTSTAKPGVFIFNGADFVRINNFRIGVDVTLPAAWGVQLLNASDNDIISNCTINIPLSSVAGVNNGIFAGTNTTTTGNYANNLLVQNNIINGGYYGVFIMGTTTGTATNGNRIIGNQIRDPFAYGVYITTGGTGTIIEGNDISRPTRVNGGAMYGIYLGGATTSTVVSKNRIHNTHDATVNQINAVYGIYTLAPATPGNENIIKNNLIYNINNNGGSFYAFYNSGGNSTYYYHNTVSVDNPAITFTIMRGLYTISASTNVKFINNILSLASPGATKHSIYLANNSIALVSNNNDLYVGASGNIGYYATDKVTLADWKTAQTNGNDQNSISTDPVFSNPSNFLRPLVPAMDNGGQPVPSVTEDIVGVTRSTTTPDMGAYEFAAAASDAGVTAIVSPTSPVTPGSQAVQVTLKNFGTAALTTASIGWSVNGVNQTVIPWTGNLSSLQATATPVNIGNFNFVSGNYTIKAWSQSPNGVTDGVLANDTTILRVFSCAPFAGNYTINKNNPTAGTNFQSLTEAAQRLSSCGVSGPVTLTVAPNSGPYNEQVELGTIPFASATNTVTFEGSGNTVSAQPVGKPGIFVLNGTDYVKINNFTITLPAGATAGWGIQLVNAADNNIISNNTINLPLTVNTGDVNGIVAGAVIQLAGNHTSNTRIQNNIINGGFNGIQLNGNNGSLTGTSNQITGNQIRDFYTYGIYILNTTGTLIEGNDISRPLRTNGNNTYGVYLTGPSQNTIVSKNRMHDFNDGQPTGAGSAYGVYSTAAATVGNENIIKNNAIYNMPVAGSSFIGLYNAGANGTWYYHNTVMSDAATTYNLIRGIHFTSASTNVKLINNLMYLPGGSNTKYAIYVANTTISLVSNNNNLYVGTAPNSYVGYFSTNLATLTDWKTANLGAYDQSSVSVDPLFAAPATGNLRPTTVVLDNIGQPVPTVTDDILGAARSTATPDPGAFEFGAPANDAGIVAVSGPNPTSCSLSATDSITVTIKNFGGNTLTSIPVNYSLNGVFLAAPETFTGSLAPNGTVNYTFAAKANLGTPGSYEVVAKTLLTGDLTTFNDSDTMRVTNSMVSGMPVSLDFETATTGISRFRKVDKPYSNISEGAGASFGATSTKGLILDGVNNSNWVTPAGVTDPWTNNLDNFAGAYFCISPAGGLATDSLIMTFDLKQLFKTANTSTNFRVTVNGTQVGPTYRPPFSGTPINWQKVKVDLSTYKNDPTVQIGLESNVKEAYANATGTANLIDNLEIKRVSGIVSGVKADANANQVHVFPNPSTGTFNVRLENGMEYDLKVTDLSGKVILSQKAKGNAQLNLEGTAKGIYLLKVTSDNGSAVRKLIVE